ncbi:MAG: carbohydrate ABC transporter permease [Ilumatobacter sp.]|uniref:carbohydrate ABC transporter permease n=1 Tax=Ilumatobacter sp. TaxID=1967498 RepID=UPI0026022FC3|nr:carbohydrate ABC transporter permease [Ilumatobacter sp.]MDJ0769694.1 carbohydrate ABC transporter permease [Ilumatobacter sp.]
MTNAELPALDSPEVVELHRKMRRRSQRGRVGAYVVAILVALWIFVPILFIFSMAFTTAETVRSYPKNVLPFIPFSTDTMQFFLESEGVAEGLWNSILVAMITLVLSTIIATPAGYAIARYAFRGRDLFRLSVLAVRAFPIVVLSIPLAVLFIRADVFDSVWSLALMHTALTMPTTLLVIASVFASVPYELEEAGQVFGATAFQSFRHIVVPLVLPGIAAAGLFTFVLSWNEVFAASVLTLENRTLPALVLNSLGESSDAFQFAGGFALMLPSIIFMFFVRKYLFNMWGQVTK